MVTIDTRSLTARDRPGTRWLGPLPIWGRPGPAGLRLADSDGSARPAILRFDHDDFMQEYLDLLQRAPERLGDWLARPETWRQPMPSPRREDGEEQPGAEPARQVSFVYDATRREVARRRRRLPSAINLLAARRRDRRPPPPAQPEELPLKLYQASQQRHYLLCASLVDDLPGLPDREPDLRRGERVSFVVRRLLPPEDWQGGQPPAFAEWDEWAFVPGEQGNAWQRLGPHGSPSACRLAPGEEQLPMFPSALRGDCGQARRLFCASIPVNRREQWLGAALGGDVGIAGVPASSGPGQAALLLQADVVAPWKLLLEQAERLGGDATASFAEFGSGGAGADRDRLLREARDRLQTGAWYVLLDLARFLRQRLPGVWAVLAGESGDEGLDERGLALVAALRGARVDRELARRLLHGGRGPTEPAGARYGHGDVVETLAEALLAALDAGPGLEAVESSFARFGSDGEALAVDPDWPGFLFPLADPELEPPLPALPAGLLDGLAGLERRQAAVDGLADLILALLPEGEAGSEESAPAATGDEAWFVLRCVYQRPACGPLSPPLLSAPSARFQMAAFFDPDAPARPVRIPMPLDISPAGLRKYQKNTGFVISDMLCGKIKGIRKMTLADLVLSVLPWPLHKDLPDPDRGKPCRDAGGNGLGMICSLSIPIVTLCALILMMIMVALFDVIFRWLPYLFVCLPVPGLKGKKA